MCISRIKRTMRLKRYINRHGIGIVLPVPCRFAVIGFGARRFAGHRVDGPGPAAGGVQLPLLLLRELLVGDEFFHGFSFHRSFGFSGRLRVIRRRGLQACHFERSETLRPFRVDPYLFAGKRTDFSVAGSFKMTATEQTPFVYPPLRPVGFSPIAHLVQDWDQRFAFLRKAVFHLRRDLRIFLAADQSVGF